MSEATLILPNMRGGCATVGSTVHTLFRVSGRRTAKLARPDEKADVPQLGRDATPDPQQA